MSSDISEILERSRGVAVEAARELEAGNYSRVQELYDSVHEDLSQRLADGELAAAEAVLQEIFRAEGAGLHLLPKQLKGRHYSMLACIHQPELRQYAPHEHNSYSNF